MYIVLRYRKPTGVYMNEVTQHLHQFGYRDLFFIVGEDGRWRVEQEVFVPKTIEFEGKELVYKARGRTTLFRQESKRIMPTCSFILEECERRDYKKAHIPGSFYYEEWKRLREVEEEQEKKIKRGKSRALEDWNIIKRNPELMNDIAKKLEKGDSEGAFQEMTLESIAKKAYKDSPLKFKQEFKR